MRKTLVLLALMFIPVHALADGVCTPREPAAAEKQDYAAAYALFLKAAPKPPDGWTSTDYPSDGTLPNLCQEGAAERIHRSFTRSFHLERGRKDRDDRAMAAYADQGERMKAQQEANKAEIAAIDAKIEALIKITVEAVAAGKYDQIEAMNVQQQALMDEKMALMGMTNIDAESERIDADNRRDTEASFQLFFEAPQTEPRQGEPYPTVAGTAFGYAYEEKGVAAIQVMIDFEPLGGQRAVVTFQGDPERVRGLADEADLKVIAAFK
jgi:hypothetical protein